jgi:hypothetical protein
VDSLLLMQSIAGIMMDWRPSAFVFFCAQKCFCSLFTSWASVHQSDKSTDFRNLMLGLCSRLMQSNGYQLKKVLFINYLPPTLCGIQFATICAQHELNELRQQISSFFITSEPPKGDQGSVQEAIPNACSFLKTKGLKELLNKDLRSEREGTADEKMILLLWCYFFSLNILIQCNYSEINTRELKTLMVQVKELQTLSKLNDCESADVSFSRQFLLF